MERKGQSEMGEKRMDAPKSRPVGEDTLNDILAMVDGKNGRPAAQPEAPAGAQSAGASTTTQIEVDEKFRDFFTNTVAVIPDSALAGGTAPAPEEEHERPARRGLFGWLASLFGRGGDEPEDDGEPDDEVLMPGRPLPAPEEPTGEILLEMDEPEDDTVQIDLHMMEEQPAPRAGDLTGEIRLDEMPGQTPAAPQKAAEEKGSGRIRFGERAEKPRRSRPARPEPPAAPAETEAGAARPEPPAPERLPEPQAAQEPAAKLRFDDIDIAAILAEGAAAAGKKAGQPLEPLPLLTEEDLPRRTEAELLDALAGIGPSREPAGETAPARRVPERLVTEIEEPAGEITLEPLAEQPQREAPAIAQPEAPAKAEVEEPTGEITLEPLAEQPQREAPALARPEAPAKAEVEEPTGEITLEPLAEQPQREAPAPAQPEAPAKAEIEEPTGEIALEPLTEQTIDEQTAGETQPAESEAAAAAVRGRAHTAAIRLFGTEEEPDAEGPQPAAKQPEAAAEQTTKETAEEQPEPAPAATEYEDPADAGAVAQTLEKTVARLTLRTALTGILAAALLVLGLMAQGVVPQMAALDPELAPAAFLGVNLVLLAAAAAVSYPILCDGLLGLVKKPSPDTLPALAAVAAALQLAVCLLLGAAFDPAKVTLFAAAAALLLFADTLGSRLMAAVVRDNFELVSAGVDHEAAYRLRDQKLAQTLAAGMDEDEPVLLLNRPAALVKGFLAQSFSARRSDRTAQKLARVLLGTAAVCAVIALVRGGPLNMVTAFAGVLCLGAPLSATLISAVPSLLMQRAASRVGAVIPGWYNIAQLGQVDMIQVDASELFTPACAQLFGIKTFQKERIDLAILYATSILIAGCNTLEGLFREMIENKTEMLYEVKDLQKKPGLGFTGWCDNCRVVLGTRAMMALEEIPLPALDYENRYSKDGRHQVLYLAVSGKLYAMFLLGYTGERGVAHSMATLRRENIRLLVTAEDPTLTAERIEAAYHLERGFVKVLSAQEQAALAPATQYLRASEGCMMHLGGFASLVGGLKAAAGADEGERSACTVQLVSVLFSVLLALFLSVTGGLTGVSLLAALLYQIAWSALSVAITLTKKY